MTRLLPVPALTRRLGAVAATVLLGALLVGCGQESDSDPAPTESASETSETEAEPDAAAESDTESDTESGATEGDLPSWAPQIITEGDDVTGLDFSDIDPLSDELLIHQVTTGDGPPLEVGQNLTANYFGQLPDAAEPFDESFSREPFTIPIGVGNLIPGWDEGLVGIPVGSRVVMSIPSDLGYGDAGSPPAIPGGATLFFVVDIVDAA